MPEEVFGLRVASRARAGAAAESSRSALRAVGRLRAECCVAVDRAAESQDVIGDSANTSRSR